MRLETSEGIVRVESVGVADGEAVHAGTFAGVGVSGTCEDIVGVLAKNDAFLGVFDEEEEGDEGVAVLKVSVFEWIPICFGVWFSD